MNRVGIIVNPIAGMGGRVGLKGTDGESYEEALRRGAKPVSPRRAIEFLNHVRSMNFEIVAAAGLMGEEEVLASNKKDLLRLVVGEKKERTTADDTKAAAKEMVGKGVDIIVFVGGDGTARDILDAVDEEIPILGVPSGVKMFSAIFAVNPRAAAKVLDEFLAGRTSLVEREVLDIDEEAYRKGVLRIRLYGYLKVPMPRNDLLQYMKTISKGGEEEENKLAIARTIVEEMEPDTLYLLGPGTTVKAIADLLDIDKTLLGVDAIVNKRLVGKDLDEASILRLLDQYGRAKIIVSPIGGQGFIFGRGNQQISPRVIRRIGKDNIIVIATWNKIKDLPYLRVDTGDPDVDEMLRGYVKILVDYGRYIVKKIV